MQNGFVDIARKEPCRRSHRGRALYRSANEGSVRVFSELQTTDHLLPVPPNGSGRGYPWKLNPFGDCFPPRAPGLTLTSYTE